MDVVEAEKAGEFGYTAGGGAPGIDGCAAKLESVSPRHRLLAWSGHCGADVIADLQYYE